MARWAAGVVAVAFLAACGDRRAAGDAAGSSAPAPTGTAPAVPRSQAQRPLIDFLASLPQCDIGHKGLVVDGGTNAFALRYGWTGAIPQGLTDVEHDGSTWLRVGERKVDLLFASLERQQIFVAARGQGDASKAAQVLLDDQPLGTLSFPRGQIRVATTGTTTMPVDPGIHVLTLRFSGRAKDQGGFADLDWLRVGVPDDPVPAGEPQPPPENYGAPTLKDVVAPAAAIGGVPHKSIALRAPGYVRCSTRLTQQARIKASIGLLGPGSADAEIRILADGRPPQVVQTLHLDAAAATKWVDVDRALGDFGTGLATVELVATQARRGSRVLFGDPVVVPSIEAPAPPPRPARAVVIVVVDGVERAEMPPWNASPAPLLATFGDLSVSATVFDQHRASTTVVPGVVASLLTGLSPRQHGLVDLAARLPPSVATLATVARDASVRTAMFTGVPTTFRAFGFAEGWEKFVEYTPSSGDPATAPIDSAAAWITEVAHASKEPRMLAVVHARGGHPPWDVRDTTTLPPKDYTGFVDARRGAQILGKMRHRRVKEPLADADRVRIRALEQVALGGQDHAIGALISSLKTANLWDTTLFIVTGDVSSGASDASLFGDGLPLTEQLLTLPLYVHFPGSAHAAERVKEPTEIVDLTRTVVDALGLSFARPFEARDLGRIADNPNGSTSAPQIATLGEKYAARWASVVVSGRFPKPPVVCDLALDPVCAFDRRDLMPVSTYAIFQRLVAADVAARARGMVREPATLDPETLAALNVWGSD